jgi:predicted nucleic acid-binding Zn ribbon protein
VHFRRKLRLRPLEPVTVLPPARRRREAVALAVLVIFAVLILVVFLKIRATMQ